MKFIKFFQVLLMCVCLSNFTFGEWIYNIAGNYDQLYEVKIGDGRNDGVNRVYTSTASGHLLEWTFAEGQWEMVDCGATPPETGDNRMLISIWLGDARNDGTTCVYGASSNGNVYEFFYNGSLWQMTQIGETTVGLAAITVGDSRNNGNNYIITGGWENPIWELGYSGSDWGLMEVSQEHIHARPMEIGQGRNDGVNRVYLPGWFHTDIREYTWNGSSYDRYLIDTDDDFIKVAIADVKGDGLQRIYASEAYGHILEMTFNDGNWDIQDIQTDAPDLSRYGLADGTPNLDGQKRLYSVAQGGSIREHTWNGSNWEDYEIDAISGATSDLTVGDGRGDGTERVYVAGYNGNLYEFSHVDSSVICTVSGSVISTNSNINIEDVVIKAGDIEMHPESDGTFSFQIFPGNYTMTVTLEGHAPVSNELSLGSSDIVNLYFMLEYLIPVENLQYTYSNSNIVLNWDFEGSEEESFDHFNIYRRIANSNWSAVGNTDEATYSEPSVLPFELYYYVAAVYTNGVSDSSNVVVVPPLAINEEYELQEKASVSLGNYPNPFNPETTITYTLESGSYVNLTICNVKGQVIRSFIETDKEAGTYSTNWDGKDSKGNTVGSGIYFCSLKTLFGEEIRKMILMK